jgi:hypothetical protein
MLFIEKDRKVFSKEKKYMLNLNSRNLIYMNLSYGNVHILFYIKAINVFNEVCRLSENADIVTAYYIQPLIIHFV